MIKLAEFSSRYRARLIAKAYTRWIKPKEKILDVGSGTGIVAVELSKLLKVTVSGCDIEEYLIEKIPFKKMEAHDKLPFKDKSFDTVMFNDVLHHTDYENQKKLLKEAERVTKKQILAFELRPTLSGKLADFLINKIHYIRMNIPFTYRTTSEWKSLFEDLGFKYEAKEVRKPFLYPFSHIAFRLF